MCLQLYDSVLDIEKLQKHILYVIAVWLPVRTILCETAVKTIFFMVQGFCKNIYMHCAFIHHLKKDFDPHKKTSLESV